MALEEETDLIIDEKKGRKVALSYGIDVLGLLGILEINLLKHKINHTELLYILDEFKQAGYRLSSTLEKEFLQSLGEKSDI